MHRDELGAVGRGCDTTLSLTGPEDQGASNQLNDTTDRAAHLQVMGMVRIEENSSRQFSTMGFRQVWVNVFLGVWIIIQKLRVEYLLTLLLWNDRILRIND